MTDGSRGRRSPTEGSEDPSSTSSTRLAWLAVCVLLCGTFIGTINNSIANVAVPSMADDLDVELSTAVWIVSGFALALGAFMAVAGRLGDLYGPRRTYLVGTVVFSLASLVVATGDHILVVVAGRILQGASGAPVLPCILATISRLFGREHRAGPVALWAVVNSAALAAGPAVGGVIVDHLGWRAIFFITSPLMLLVAVLVVVFVPVDEPVPRERLDVPGAVMVAVTLGCLVVPVTEGTRWGWTAAPTLGLLGAAAVLGLALCWHLGRVRNPFIQPALFKYPGFLPLTAVAGLQMIVLFGVTFTVPVFFVVADGRSAGSAGLITSVLPAFMFVGASFVSRVSARLDISTVLSWGALVMAAGVVGVMVFTPSPLAVALALVPLGVGISFIQAPTASALTSLVPEDQTGAAAGVFNTARFVLGGIGASAAAVLFDIGSGRAGDADITLDHGITGMRVALLLALASSLAIVVLARRSDLGSSRRGEGTKRRAGAASGSPSRH